MCFGLSGSCTGYRFWLWPHLRYVPFLSPHIVHGSPGDACFVLLYPRIPRDSCELSGLLSPPSASSPHPSYPLLPLPGSLCPAYSPALRTSKPGTSLLVSSRKQGFFRLDRTQCQSHNHKIHHVIMIAYSSEEISCQNKWYILLQMQSTFVHFYLFFCLAPTPFLNTQITPFL